MFTLLLCVVFRTITSSRFLMLWDHYSLVFFSNFSYEVILCLLSPSCAYVSDFLLTMQVCFFFKSFLNYKTIFLSISWAAFTWSLVIDAHWGNTLMVFYMISLKFHFLITFLPLYWYYDFYSIYFPLTKHNCHLAHVAEILGYPPIHIFIKP